jgi:hypothetical protein
MYQPDQINAGGQLSSSTNIQLIRKTNSGECKLLTLHEKIYIVKYVTKYSFI